MASVASNTTRYVVLKLILVKIFCVSQKKYRYDGVWVFSRKKNTNIFYIKEFE